MANHTAPLAKACSGRLLNLMGGLKKLLQSSSHSVSTPYGSLTKQLPCPSRSLTHISLQRPLLLRAGNFRPLLPPTKPHLSLCLRSLPPALSCALSQTPAPSRKDGWLLREQQQCQALADRPEGSCSAAQGAGIKAQSRQPAEKHAYERQTRKQAKKAPFPASAPLPSARTPAQRGSSPWRMRAPLCASQPLRKGSPPPAKPAPGPMALRKLVLGTGTAAAGWEASWAWTCSLLAPLPPFPSLALGALHCKPSWASAPLTLS